MKIHESNAGIHTCLMAADCRTTLQAEKCLAEYDDHGDPRTLNNGNAACDRPTARYQHPKIHEKNPTVGEFNYWLDRQPAISTRSFSGILLFLVSISPLSPSMNCQRPSILRYFLRLPLIAMFTIHFLSTEAFPMLQTSAEVRTAISNVDSRLDSKRFVNLQVVEK